jgi:DNA-binding NarL/FixJ family response regulator
MLQRLGLSAEEEEFYTQFSAADSELLSLAVAGLTDEAMAHQLNVSRRTIERRLRKIMQCAGATSRVQLGLLAARRGWL